MRFSRYLFLRLNRCARQACCGRFVAAWAFDISNMVYKLNHGYTLMIFIGRAKKELDLQNIA
jgi:hypothetical protein